MPNWCDNHIRIRHDSKAEIDRIEAAAESGILQELIPCPAELLDERTGSYGGEDAEDKDQLREQLKAKYGFSGWYEWQCANWGTKWDLCEPSIERIDDNTIAVSCGTAWAPPIPAYERMEEMGYEVEAFYFEPGMCFAGVWRNGYDDCYSDWGDSQGAKDMLPEELDEMFCISQSQAEWEEEERMEDDLYRWTVEGAQNREEAA